jgi:putative transposase
VLLSQGRTVTEVVKTLGVSEVTYYRWRQEYGGLKASQARRMKEKENARLRKAVADLTLDKLILQEAARGNFRAPPATGCASLRCSKRSAVDRQGSSEPIGAWVPTASR